MDTREIENINDSLNRFSETVKHMSHTLDEIDSSINRSIKIDEVDRKLDEIKKGIDLQTNDIDKDNIFGKINILMMVLFFVITSLRLIAVACALYFDENTVVNYNRRSYIFWIYIVATIVFAIITLISCVNSTESEKTPQKANIDFLFILGGCLIIIAMIPSLILSVDTLLVMGNVNGLNETLRSYLVTTESYCNKLLLGESMLFVINLYALFIKENNSKTWRFNALTLAIAFFSIMLSLVS